MKKLMILAVAMIAMAMGGEAEAALRFHFTISGSGPVPTTILPGSTVDVTANYDFLTDTYGVSNTGVQLRYGDGHGGFATITFSLAATTNWDGTPDSGFFETSVNIIGVTSTAFLNLNGASFTVGAMIQEDSSGSFKEALFVLPLDGTDGIHSPAATVSGGTTKGGTAVTTSTFITDVGLISQSSVSLIDNPALVGFPNSVSPAPMTPLGTISNYALRNTIEITIQTGTVGTTGPTVGSTQTLKTSVVPGAVVPEPTSLALAGFAGIGMAVGAIRRRRQAKQAA